LRRRDRDNVPIARLSEQQILDCTYTKTGCKGGWPADAFSLLAQNGANTDFNDPYTGVYKGTGCSDKTGRLNLNMKQGPRPNAWMGSLQPYYAELVPQNDVNALKLAVSDGPVSFTMYVADDFFDFGKGVYTAPASCAQNQPNHAMVICGYDTDKVTGKQFWMVKNSWGKDFGDGGYIKVELGKNICQIESGVIAVPTLDMSKKTDMSNLCVNDKACKTDSDCSAVAKSCVSGRCVCRPCISNVVCTTDADCGGKLGSCAKGGDGIMQFVRQVSSSKNYCACNKVCKDDDSSCDSFKKQGFCAKGNKFEAYMSGSCRKSCGLCA